MIYDALYDFIFLNFNQPGTCSQATGDAVVIKEMRRRIYCGAKTPKCKVKNLCQILPLSQKRKQYVR